RRPRRTRQTLPPPTVGWPGTASRYRAGDRDRSHLAAVRRADRRSRSEGRRRGAATVANAQSRTREDDRDGHARSACGRTRKAHAPPGEGHVDGGRGVRFLPLIWKNIWRRKIRTIFTMLSIFVAFLLFGLLMTIRAAFSIGVELAGIDRLIIIH